MKQIWGYHIATTVGLPQRLLARGGKFCFGGDALLFMTVEEADEYMKEYEISSKDGCIVECECSDFMRKTHIKKK